MKKREKQTGVTERDAAIGGDPGEKARSRNREAMRGNECRTEMEEKNGTHSKERKAEECLAQNT